MPLLARLCIAAVLMLAVAGCRGRVPRPGKPIAPPAQTRLGRPAPPLNGEFSRDYLQQGPAAWPVQIGRRAAQS